MKSVKSNDPSDALRCSARRLHHFQCPAAERHLDGKTGGSSLPPAIPSAAVPPAEGVDDPTADNFTAENPCRGGARRARGHYPELTPEPTPVPEYEGPERAAHHLL